VVLLGDDSYDPRQFQGAAARSWVPSLMAWDGQFGRVASENRYADVDGDGLPDLAIGRLPANTPAEASILLEKIERFSPAIGAAVLDTEHVVAVDDQGPADPPFSQFAGQVRSWWPGSITVADSGQGVAQARQTLLAGLAANPRTLHFFGHGGPQTWTDEGLLVPEDLAALTGTGGRTVLFAWTCEAQWYQDTLSPSINESLLLVPQGGVAASFGPSGISDPFLQKALSVRVYKGLAAGLTLGEAIRDAKRGALQASASLQPLVDGWHLLGDPALALSPQPVLARGDVRDARFRVTLGATRP